MTSVMCLFVITLVGYIILVYTSTDQSDSKGVELTNSIEEVKPRIRQGQPAYLGEYPWIAYINYRDRRNGKGYSCAGSIISHRQVLTAAHCCSNSKFGTLWIRAGEFNLNMNPDCKFQMFNTGILGFGCDSYYRDYKGEKVSVVKPYDRKTFPSGDICIARTSEDIAFNKYIHEINLPFDHGVDFISETFEGQYLWILGWGAVDENAVFFPITKSFLLMRGLVRVCSLEECIRKWRLKIFDLADNIGSEHICAESSQGTTVCRGDSGGPLMLTKGGKTYIIGVTSGSSKCIYPSPADLPAVFVRVDQYKDWIKENMQ